MVKENRQAAPTALASRHLCTVEFEVGSGIIAIGASPFGDQRLGYISGGRFFGPRINGTVLPGGGNWSRSGRMGEDASVGTFDARAVWQSEDGELIYVSYTGRSIISDDARATFADPAVPDADTSQYYLRIAPVFETASAKYGWLNDVLAVGVGERTDFGVRHQIYEVL